MYFTIEQINSNINSKYGINNDLQLSLTNGNAQFIIQISRQMKISYTIPSLALHISQIFFQKKCYLFYDRFLILTASFALASKLKDMDCRLKTVCNSYYNIISRMTMNYEPFNQEKMKKIKDQICIAETQILRTLQYKIDFNTPHDYLKKYVEVLNQPRQIIKKVYNSSRIIIIDSYRSKCCLLYNPLTISIAALLIACRYEGFRPYVSESVKEELKREQLHTESIKEELKREQPRSIVSEQNNQQKLVRKQSFEQGQIAKQNQQQIQKEQQDIKNQKISNQELYKHWINMIRTKQNQVLNQIDILNCIKMINSIIIDTWKW